MRPGWQGPQAENQIARLERELPQVAWQKLTISPKKLEVELVQRAIYSLETIWVDFAKITKSDDEGKEYPSAGIFVSPAWSSHLRSTGG